MALMSLATLAPYLCHALTSGWSASTCGAGAPGAQTHRSHFGDLRARFAIDATGCGDEVSGIAPVKEE